MIIAAYTGDAWFLVAQPWTESLPDVIYDFFLIATLQDDNSGLRLGSKSNVKRKNVLVLTKG